MADWAHILLLFGGVMAVVYILPALLKLVFRIVSSILFLGLLFVGVMVYTGKDISGFVDKSVVVVASVVHEVVSYFS